MHVNLRRGRLAAAAAGVIAATLVTLSPPVAASPTVPAAGTGAAAHHQRSNQAAHQPRLPAPPPPPKRRPTAAVAPRATAAAVPAPTAATTPAATTPAATTPAAATAASNGKAAPGADTARRTLVLYDSTGPWGWLGEAYAVQASNLISHGSASSMHPVASYAAGEMAGYTSVVYVGSTYDEPLPTAFLDDVLAGARPVLWMYDNIWQLTARAANFAASYGWTWDQFDFSQTPTVTYKNTALQRDPLAAPSGLMATHITDPAKARVLATATRTDGSTLPWAVTGGNLTYIGEVPFSYVGPTDRYFAAADLLLANARPGAPDRHRALVRIEDVSSDADPAELRAVADFLSSRNIPFTVGVIPLYTDPNGYYNNGVAQTIPLAQAPGVVNALKYMQRKGGTLLMHGYTHQYSTVANPYDGVTGDDFEFYRAHIDAANNVVYDTPPAEDSAAWVDGRIASARAGFTAAGLPQPTIFEPPHYAASAVDYQEINTQFGVRYDRGLYAAGWCPNGACGTGTPDYTRIYGQYFPFLVRDAYGSVVIPEDLGNVELEWFNNHPPRFPADILASAKGVSVVRDGVQSFFYHPYLGTSYLQQIVDGVTAMGYQFVPAATVAAG